MKGTSLALDAATADICAAPTTEECMQARWVTWMPVAVVIVMGIVPGDLPAQIAEPRYEAEIRLLAERPQVRDALRTIEAHVPTLVRDLIALTEIEAPPFREDRRAAMIRSWLAGAVDSVWIDDEGNVLGLRRGTGTRVIALSAHMDTVFPEGTDVTVRQRGDTLFAPGIFDNTQGVMAMFAVLRALNEARLQTDASLLFVATVGEEGLGDLRGVKYLFKSGPTIDSWIAIDGGGTGRITNGGLGSLRYRIRYGGPGGHSWGAFGLANPQHALGQAIAAFVSEADAYTRDEPRTSYNVGRLGGGTSVNSIPFEAWMEVDMRSVSSERLLGIDRLLKQAVQQALEAENARRRTGPPLTVDVQLVGDRPSGVTDPSVPLVQRAIAATRYLGAAPELSTSSTDSNVPIALGVPGITIGGGGEGGRAHALDEWWLDRGTALGIQKALLILLAEAGVRP